MDRRQFLHRTSVLPALPLISQCGDSGVGAVPAQALPPTHPRPHPLALLLGLLARGAAIAPTLLLILAGKLVLDVSWHAWALRHYQRWLGSAQAQARQERWLQTCLAEPFSFQILRHSASAWGWWLLLSRQQSWSPQPRNIETPAP